MRDGLAGETQLNAYHTDFFVHVVVVPVRGVLYGEQFLRDPEVCQRPFFLAEDAVTLGKPVVDDPVEAAFCDRLFKLFHGLSNFPLVVGAEAVLDAPVPLRVRRLTT